MYRAGELGQSSTSLALDSESVPNLRDAADCVQQCTERFKRRHAARKAPLRLIGLAFLIPGVVSTSMPPGFAIPAAGGDYVTALLALIAMVAIHSRSKLGRPAAWVFNIVGTVDLLNASFKLAFIECLQVTLGRRFSYPQR